MIKHHKTPLEATTHVKLNERYFAANYIFDKAYGRWPQILESLGINASYLKNEHGPCPACGGKDRFRFDDKNKGCFICSKCGSGYGIQLLQNYHGWDFSFALKMVSHHLGLEGSFIHPGSRYADHYLGRKVQSQKISYEAEKNKKYILNSIWKFSQPITMGDPVCNYLISRGINLISYPSVLRYHPSLPYFENKILIGKFPAMLALVTNQNNAAVTIHRTYLGDSCKADVLNPKKLMSPILPNATKGSAIKLHEPIDGMLAIAEGIETALAFSIATHIPVWAAISAGGMEQVILPSSVTDITIAVDNDKSGRGQEAAIRLAQRLLMEGRKVRRVMPPIVGFDFADMLMEKK